MRSGRSSEVDPSFREKKRSLNKAEKKQFQILLIVNCSKNATNTFIDDAILVLFLDWSVALLLISLEIYFKGWFPVLQWFWKYLENVSLSFQKIICISSILFLVNNLISEHNLISELQQDSHEEKSLTKKLKNSKFS